MYSNNLNACWTHFFKMGYRKVKEKKKKAPYNVKPNVTWNYTDKTIRSCNKTDPNDRCGDGG